MIAKLKAAWNYSRTIFLNVASVLVLGLGEALAWAVNAPWASVISSPKVLFAVTMFINLANIYLRTITTTPVGDKDGA